MESATKINGHDDDQESEEIDQDLRERVQEVEYKENESTSSKTDLLLKVLDSQRWIKGSLLNIMDCLDNGNVIERSGFEGEGEVVEEGIELDEEMRAIWNEFDSIRRLATQVERRVGEFNEVKKKEKKELESSVVSLTQENRDINTLLRVALVEKEAVEKTLNKLRGGNDQKRVALLQIAERGLRGVGFGFMMGGGGSTEQATEPSTWGANSVVASNATITTASSNASTKSDSSECEEEVVSLASTVEKIMKNLRVEISELRRSLDESRSDTERLQSLVAKQSQQISENKLYIKELEDRERVLSQHVDELLSEIKETEAEVARWRRACEMEVEAGKNEIEERDKLIVILKQELGKTKAALEITSGKVKLKEELAAAAMAAQEAADKSLQLADNRSAGLRDRIEELTRQLEELEGRERGRRRIRHICWPWLFLKMNSTNNTRDRVQNVRRTLPEMQALLHYSA